MKRQFKIIVLFALLIGSNSNAQSNSKTETLSINWPKDEDWHIVDQQDNETGTMTAMILLKGKETIVNHSEMVTRNIYHSPMTEPIESEIEQLYEMYKKNAPTTKKALVEKDEKAKHPWFIYKIEAPTETLIFYAIQGNYGSYSSLWSTKQKELTPQSQEKWVKIFKSSKIILE